MMNKTLQAPDVSPLEITKLAERLRDELDSETRQERMPSLSGELSPAPATGPAAVTADQPDHTLPTSNVGPAP